MSEKKSKDVPVKDWIPTPVVDHADLDRPVPRYQTEYEAEQKKAKDPK